MRYTGGPTSDTQHSRRRNAHTHTRVHAPYLLRFLHWEGSIRPLPPSAAAPEAFRPGREEGAENMDGGVVGLVGALARTRLRTVHARSLAVQHVLESHGQTATCGCPICIWLGGIMVGYAAACAVEAQHREGKTGKPDDQGRQEKRDPGTPPAAGARAGVGRAVVIPGRQSA